MTDPTTSQGDRMRLNDYQQKTAATAIYPGAGNPNAFGALTYVTLGLVGEAGEIANKVKKIYRDHAGTITPHHREQLRAELGDVLWYVAQLATQLNTNLQDVAQANLTKLSDRQTRGALTGSGDTR